MTYNLHHMKQYARQLIKKPLDVCESCGEKGKMDIYLPPGTSIKEAKILCKSCRAKAAAEDRT